MAKSDISSLHNLSNMGLKARDFFFYYLNDKEKVKYKKLGINLKTPRNQSKALTAKLNHLDLSRCNC